MNVSIFGLGYVGCVSLGCLANNGHNVIGVDINKMKVEMINRGESPIVEKGVDELISSLSSAGRIRATFSTEEAVHNSEISIIAVGTPSSSHGHLNLNFIYKVVENIAEVLKEKKSFHTIAIRSTVLPGTCEKAAHAVEKISGKQNNVHFAIVSNPEFLREGTAVFDYYHPPFTLIGSENDVASSKLAELYKGIDAKIIISNTKEAEIIKYVNNSFHALKVTFANEVGNICQALGINSRNVMNIFVEDKQLNISQYYLKPGFAFGGSCLPKDLKALKTLAHDLYLDTPVINNIEISNNSQINRAVKLIIAQNKKKLGVLGLSFKAETDDLRNSSAVILIEALLGKGFSISIYDKLVSYSHLTGKNKEYIDSHIPHLSNLLSEDINKTIESSELLIVSKKEAEFNDVLKNVNNKLIIDLAGLDDEIQSLPNYMGINW